MLISHRSQFIFTKTAKTAGTSVEVYFEPFCRSDREEFSHETDEYESDEGIVGFRGVTKPAECRWYNHMPASQIRDQLGADRWNRYFKFCTVRNPFDKAVSSFFHMRTLNLWKADREFSSDREAFEHWLIERGPPNDRDRYLIDGEFCLDFAIRYEDLEVGMDFVCRKFSLPWKPEKMPRLKSNYRDRSIGLREIYSDESIEIIRQCYQFEFEFFKYSIPF